MFVDKVSSSQTRYDCDTWLCVWCNGTLGTDNVSMQTEEH